MAAVESLPARAAPERVESIDEKFDEKAEQSSVFVADPVKGDVYDDLRDIDMGEDGKERPIGETAVPNVSLIIQLNRSQKLISTSQRVSSLLRMTPVSQRSLSGCGSLASGYLASAPCWARFSSVLCCAFSIPPLTSIFIPSVLQASDCLRQPALHPDYCVHFRESTGRDSPWPWQHLPQAPDERYRLLAIF